jgi:DNA polymerase (family X)
VLTEKNELLNNRALEAIFHRMAACYRYLGPGERFRAIAYEKAARVLQNMQDDIALHAGNIKSLDAMSGIGESIAEKIIEYLDTGSVKKLEQLKEQVPYELLELMDISGFGPATVKLLNDRMQIHNREQLLAALVAGKLQGLKGFGANKAANLLRALKLVKQSGRMLLKDAEKLGNKIIQQLSELPGVQRAALAGSLRRKKATIGDIDIVVLAAPQYRNRIVEKFTTLPGVSRVLAKGSTRVSVVLKEGNVQVDIRLVHDFEYGAAMLYFTGSKEHNIKLRTIARGRGYRINEYGIFEMATGRRVAGETEEEMYRFLGLNYIPPEQRLDEGEIERAVVDKIKKQKNS